MKAPQSSEGEDSAAVVSVLRNRAPLVEFLSLISPNEQGCGHGPQPPNLSLDPMTQPVIVTMPHRLGKEEAARRIKAGLESTQLNFGGLLSLEQAIWNGDRVEFYARALGQSANGSIEVRDDHILLEIRLPWILAKLADKIAPAVRKETVLLLEKK